MATQSLIQPLYAGSIIHKERNFKGGPEYPHWREAASQTFGIGDLLFLDAGQLKICTVNGSNQLSSAVAVQAKKAASGTTNGVVHAYAIRPDEEFYFNVYHATPASAITAESLLGTVKAIIKIGGKWHADIENAAEGAGDATGRILITDIPGKAPDGTKNTIGDTYGIVIAQFVPRSISTDGDPNARTLQLWPG